MEAINLSVVWWWFARGGLGWLPAGGAAVMLMVLARTVQATEVENYSLIFWTGPFGLIVMVCISLWAVLTRVVLPGLGWLGVMLWLLPATYGLELEAWAVRRLTRVHVRPRS